MQKQFILFLLVWSATSLKAQVQFSLSSGLSYTPQKETFKQSSETRLFNPDGINAYYHDYRFVDDTITIITAAETRNVNKQEVVNDHIGFYLDFNLGIRMSDKFRFITGMNFTFNSFMTTQISNTEYLDIINVQTIPYITVFSQGPNPLNACDRMLNNEADASPDIIEAKTYTLYLQIPIEVQYQIHDKLRIRSGARVQIPLWERDNYDNAILITNSIDSEIVCHYELRNITHTRIFDFSRLNFLASTSISYLLNEQYSIDAGVNYQFIKLPASSIYSDSPKDIDRQPLRFNVGMTYFFSNT